jgi:acyl-CoA synthetase (AMP-forming)/AMP-acid ligase II
LAVLSIPALKTPIANGLLVAGSSIDEIKIITESDAGNLTGEAKPLPVLPGPKQLAFLQYTSGSTGMPKGVMVSHGQLVANLRAIQQSENMPEYLVGAGWLPQFHDMGLIGTTLQPLALGGHYIFMSPLHFLQRPLRWLHMLSRTQAAFTAAPNFALDLCVRAACTEQTEGINLQRLSTIFCGAEPVNMSSVDAFESCFGKAGLAADVIRPCYGLAEATLMVSGGIVTRDFRSLELDCNDLSRGLAVLAAGSLKRIACCGRPVNGHSVLIVDPETRQVLAPSQVGEVWFSGESVAQGYWRKTAETEVTFRAMTACAKGPYMRTGDLGFIHQEGLFITGRIKELMIIRGRNLYPHDIEATMIQALALFGDFQAAVFAADSGNGPDIVACIELPRRNKAAAEVPYDSMVSTLRMAVSQAHDVHLRDIYFLSHGKIPRTSSGKTQRQNCAAMYVSREIDLHPHTVYSTRASIPTAFTEPA